MKLKSLKIFSFLLILFCGPHVLLAEKTTFSLNDVSILLPLPQNGDDAQEMLAGLELHQGLLPLSFFDELPPLILNAVDESAALHDLRLISLRIDPCFQDFALDGPLACRKQIRLIFQPMIIQGDSFTTQDAAVHVFYEFQTEEWIQILQMWKTLRISQQLSSALSVHPTIAREGYHGPVWKKLKSILVNFCTPNKISRLTLSAVNRQGFHWLFQGITKNSSGLLEPLAIPGLSHSRQSYFVSLGRLSDFKSGGIHPLPENLPMIRDFLKDSAKTFTNVPQVQVTKFVQEFVDFENPKKIQTGHLDCARCHVAHQIRSWGEQKQLNILQDFTSLWNLQNTSTQSFGVNRVRMFGYFGREPQISQRVIHETALTVDQLNLWLSQEK